MPLTLTLTGGPGLQRFDWVRPHDRVTVLARGAFTVEAVQNRDCIVLSQPAEGHAISFEFLGTVPGVVNGQPAKRGVLEAGLVLTWQQLTVTVDTLEEPGDEERAMIDLAQHSAAAMNVYADWLEAQGELDLATWARLMLAPTSYARTSQLAALAGTVGVAFRARVSRGRIERCRQACRGAWEALEMGAHDVQRSCTRCGERVNYCGALLEVHRDRGPVVIDPSIVRHEGDLDVPVIWLG